MRSEVVSGGRRMMKKGKCCMGAGAGHSPWLGVVERWAARQLLRSTQGRLPSWLNAVVRRGVRERVCVLQRISVVQRDSFLTHINATWASWLHGIVVPSTGYAKSLLRSVVFWARSKTSMTVATIAANGSLGGYKNACFGGELA